MIDTVSDAVIDTLEIFPFILIIYILIELLEHKATFMRNRKILRGDFAPLAGAVTGIIPQCGFSVMAAKLYDRGLIRTGTLLAVFIATSDEALIILISETSKLYEVIPLIGIKIGVALLIGYAANAFLPYAKSCILPLSGGEIHAFSCGREHERKSYLRVYLIDPLIHSLKVALYILIASIVLGCIIYTMGTDTISSSFIGGPYIQPLITAAVGLIPNCAASVIITTTFINDAITFGSCVAGLCANAGLGFVILFRNTKQIKRNIILLFVMYIVSAATGIAVNSVSML